MQRQRVCVDAQENRNVFSPKSKLLLISIKFLTGKTVLLSFCLVNSKLSLESKVVLTSPVDQT